MDSRKLNIYRGKIFQIILACLLIAACKEIPTTAPSSDKYRLVWNSDPATAMTIAWDQLESANPVIYYGKQDHGRKYWKYRSTTTADRIHRKYHMNTHFASLTNLTPGESYYFVIKDDHGVSERYWFRTASDRPQAFTFMAGGDTKSSDDPLRAGQASNRIVAKLRPLFVMFNGDFNSGDGTTPEYWHQWLNDWQQQTTTDDGRMIPIVPVHGNHENGDHGNLNYIFNAPYHDGDSSKIYYSLSFGGDFFHIISLNSEIDEGGSQKDWLEADLKEHQNFTFKIAGYHKPFWPHTSGKRENEYQYNQWAQLFYKYRLNVSLDGDSHIHKITYPLRPDSLSQDSFMGFVRDDDHGTLFIGEGSWGAHPRTGDDNKPWTIASEGVNQVKWVHVYPEDQTGPDRMTIYTVKSASYDEDGKQVLFNQDIPNLTEDTLFELPAGIELLQNGDYGNAVYYPFHLNKK